MPTCDRVDYLSIVKYDIIILHMNLGLYRCFRPTTEIQCCREGFLGEVGSGAKLQKLGGFHAVKGEFNNKECII